MHDGKVTSAAEENAQLPLAKRRTGDALATFYIQRAAEVARENHSSFLLELAYGLDPRGSLSRYPLTASMLGVIETEEEAAHRKKVLGAPTLQGRSDHLLHFVVSAALTEIVGPKVAEEQGIEKELADCRPDGSGFSFDDLLANLSGIRFTAWLMQDPRVRLKQLAETFDARAFFPDPSAEPNGLSSEAFANAFGSISDERFVTKIRALKATVDAQRVLHREW
ncbi:MAG: hypothetical protein ACKVPX_01195 [Myxococcaceae bacterium]